MRREEKEREVARLKDVFSSSRAIYLTDITGLKAEALTALRRKLREHSVSYRVVKNTLATRAAQQAGLNELIEFIEGPTALAYTEVDPVTPVKLLSEFWLEEQRSRFRGALIDGRVYTVDQVTTLANLPSREELLCRVVSGISSPIYGLVTSLQSILLSLVNVIDAIAKQRKPES